MIANRYNIASDFKLSIEFPVIRRDANTMPTGTFSITGDLNPL